MKLPLLLSLSLSLWSEASAAQTPSAADLLFREGRVASDAGDHARACRAFQASLELDPGRGTRLNLALCQIQLGRLLEASKNLKLVAAQLGPDDERAAIVAESLAAIAKRLARVELRLDAGLPDGTELRVDGLRVDLAVARAPLVLDPGRHAFELAVPQHAPARVELTLDEGETRTAALSPGSAPPPTAATNARPSAKQTEQPTNQPPVPDQSRRTLGFACLGLGGAGLVSAGVSGALMLRESGIVDRECDARGCSDTGLAAGARGRTLVVVSAASLGVAAVAGAVGFYFLQSSARKQSQVAMGLQLGDGGLSLQLATSL